MPLGTIQIPFPDSTMPGTPGHFQESGWRIINSYLEPLGPAAPSVVIYRRAPGLRTFGTTVRSGFRGGIQVGGSFYAAFNNRLVTLTEAGGAAADVGALSGTAIGFFARNNRVGTPPIPAAWITAHAYFIDDFVLQGGSQYRCMIAHTSGTFATDLAAGRWLLFTPQTGPDIVFVDPDGNTAVINGTTISALVRPTDMGAPNSVCAMDGFFVFTVSDGKIWATDNNSIIIPGLSFATAENKPDGLLRGVPWAGQLFLFGPSTTEVWANAGTTPFPFQRSVVIPRGLAGPFCVAGFEDNFSRTLCWVADDNTVVRLNGYLPEKISPPDLDGLIEKVPANSSGQKRELEMSCYISRGHAFILLSSTTWSWVFDLNTQRWAERKSHLRTRSRITGGVFAFNKWLCGDQLSTNINEITNLTHTEAPGSQLITGAASSGSSATHPLGLNNVVRLTLANARQFYSDTVVVTGVGGVTAANGVFKTFVVDDTHLDLIDTVFAGSYVANTGVVTDTVNPAFRWQLDSGAVENFPVGARVGRFDCEFVTGVGMASGSHAINITGAVAGTSFPWPTPPPATANRIRLTVPHTQFLRDGDAVTVSGVAGTTEANGTWAIDVLDGTTIELNGSRFQNAYGGGGILTGLTAFDPIETDPIVEISWSDDGGQNYYAPIQRKLGRQAQTRQLVSLIACTGRSSWNARRWRLVIADPVYIGFMAAYQNQSSKVSDIG